MDGKLQCRHRRRAKVVEAARGRDRAALADDHAAVADHARRTHGVTRDQMMARHKANHIQVVYAPDAAGARTRRLLPRRPRSRRWACRCRSAAIITVWRKGNRSSWGLRRVAGLAPAATDAAGANTALAAKAAAFKGLGMQVSVCGANHGLASG